VFAGPNKTDEDGAYDARLCAGVSGNDDVYGQCMFDRSNLILKDGYLYYLTRPPVLIGDCDRTLPPCVFSPSPGRLVLTMPSETSISANNQPPALEEENRAPAFNPPETATPTPSPSPSPSPPASNQSASGAAHFRNVVQEYQAGLFRVTHPDPSNVRYDSTVVIDQSSAANAVITDTTNWKGSSGRDFQTILRFEIEYDNGGTINSVHMEATDYGNPRFGAFQGLNLTKTIALSYLSGNLVNEGRVLAAGLTKIANISTTIEDLVVNWLQYMVNNQPNA
jgi:hypothetical protein